MGVKVKGIEYDLRFDLGAMEDVENEFGSTGALFQDIKDQKYKSFKVLLRIMINSALEYAGEDKRVTDKDLRSVPLDELRKVVPVLNASMHAETIDGGEADDSVHDGYLEAIEREEKKA